MSRKPAITHPIDDDWWKRLRESDVRGDIKRAGKIIMQRSLGKITPLMTPPSPEKPITRDDLDWLADQCP